jgi:hypothetical protein
MRLRQRRLGRVSDDPQVSRAEWEARFRDAVARSGLNLAAFGRAAGFTRNVTYGLSKGRKPTPEELQRIAEILVRRARTP